VGAPCGAMYLNNSKKQEVSCVVSYNTRSDFTGTILKYDEGVAGKIAQTGHSMNIPNYQTWTGRSLIFEQEKPFTAILGVPLMWGGQVSGVIDLMHFEKGSSFKQEDMEVLNLFAGHAAIAIENTHLLQEAISRNEEVRQLSIRLEEAEENERRRIARELHDQVGQSLSALSINLNIIHSQMPEYLPGFKRRLEDSLMLIDQTTDNIRSLMSELRPAVLDDYGLKAALDWAATAIARRTELNVVVVGECKRFEPRVEIALFRIAQEALANVSRHAQAKYVKIHLDQNGSDFSMAIEDDGIGLGTTLSLESKTGGMGLRLMRERAEAIGGSLQIESSHVLGTKITVNYHDQDPAGR
jgi:signal transduction histidine kinase